MEKTYANTNNAKNMHCIRIVTAHKCVVWRNNNKILRNKKVISYCRVRRGRGPSCCNRHSSRRDAPLVITNQILLHFFELTELYSKNNEIQNIIKSIYLECYFQTDTLMEFETVLIGLSEKNENDESNL